MTYTFQVYQAEIKDNFVQKSLRLGRRNLQSVKNAGRQGEWNSGTLEYRSTGVADKWDIFQKVRKVDEGKRMEGELACNNRTS
jgi:hypothetical protein